MKYNIIYIITLLMIALAVVVVFGEGTEVTSPIPPIDSPPSFPEGVVVTGTNDSGGLILSGEPPARITPSITNTPTRTIITIWLTDDLTGEHYAAVVHKTVRPISFYKVEISEEE